MEGQSGHVDSETCGWVSVGCTQHNIGCTRGDGHVPLMTLAVVFLRSDEELRGIDRLFRYFGIMHLIGVDQCRLLPAPR